MKAVGAKNLPKLRDFMQDKKIDTVLFLGSDVNVRYFSNFVGSCLLAITNDERVLFAHPLEFDKANQQADVEEIVNTKNFDCSYGKALKKKLKRYKKIGIVKSDFPLRLFEDLKKRTRAKFIDIENHIVELRGVKFKREIELIKRSTKISNSGIKIIEEVLNEIRKGRKIKEKDIALRIEQEMREKGAEGFAFETIVATGKRSEFPHPYPSASEQIVNDMGYADFGAIYQGYCSDVTVPFVIGKISENQSRIIKAVMEAYDFAVSSIEIDIPTWKLYEKIEKLLKSKGFELKHGLGHGLGLTVHDYPSISAKPRDKIQLEDWKEIKFKENMIFTIEPGVYTKSYGCRIENDILLTKKGIKILTNSRLINLNTFL